MFEKPPTEKVEGIPCMTRNAEASSTGETQTFGHPLILSRKAASKRIFWIFLQGISE